jgi:hypothetical protein
MSKTSEAKSFVVLDNLTLFTLIVFVKTRYTEKKFHNIYRVIAHIFKFIQHILFADLLLFNT